MRTSLYLIQHSILIPPKVITYLYNCQVCLSMTEKVV